MKKNTYILYRTTSRENNKFSIEKHPGKILQQIMDEKGICLRSLACSMGISISKLREILEHKRPITRTIAIKLEDCLDIDTTFWLDLQEDYLRNLHTLITKWNLWSRSSARHKISVKS